MLELAYLIAPRMQIA